MQAGLTTNQVAKILGKHPTTVAYHAKKGHYKVRKVGGEYRYDADQFKVNGGATNVPSLSGTIEDLKHRLAALEAFVGVPPRT